MQYIKVNGTHEFFAVSFFIILGVVCWMINRGFAPFIRIEQRTTQLFQRQFGNPQMNYSDGLMNSVLTFLATYGSPTFLSILTVFVGGIFFATVDKGLAIWLLSVVSTGGIFGIFLKNLFKRKRPKEHLPFDDGYAFPSGHAIASTLFFLAILLVFLPMIHILTIRILLTSLVLLMWGGILFSRMYFHAHYIGDLFAGISLGIFWVLTSMGIYPIAVDMLQRLVK